MRSSRRFSVSLSAAVVGALVVASGGTARAASIDCSNPANVPNPVYISGSTTAKPFIAALAKALGSGVSLIYAPITACNGLQDVLAQPAQTETTTPSFASPTKGFETCTNGSAAYPAFSVDIALSDVYASTCITPQLTVGSGYEDWLGAIQPIEIVVPWTSSEFAISAEAAYVVFGFGGQSYVVSPWNDPTAVWVRGDTSAAQLMIGAAIGLSAAKWLSQLPADAGAAQLLTSATTMASTIADANATKPNTTIGILGAANSDPLKSPPGTTDAGATGGIKPLAFQATNQDCSYYADSDLSHFDKINVRQGRYAIWGPLHFVTAVDGSGNPTVNAQAANNLVPSVQSSVEAVIDAVTHKGLTDTTTPTLEQLIQAESSSYFIPDCAMQVSRSSELGPEASYQPPVGCGCYFESLTGGGTTLSPYCTACKTDTDCGEGGAYPHCNFGYCEAQ